MENDSRILDFRNDNIEIPSNFLLNEYRNMMLACGDGIKDHDKNITDIEFYTKKNLPINIFCCSYDYNDINLKINIDYILCNPELNIILCLFNNENINEINKLINLFKNSIDHIGTDDSRFMIPANITYEILNCNGIIHDIDTRKKNQEYLDTNKFNEILDKEKYKETYRFILLSTFNKIIYNKICKITEYNEINEYDTEIIKFKLKYLLYKKKYLQLKNKL